MTNMKNKINNKIMTENNFYSKCLIKLIKGMDLIVLILVISFLINDIISIFISIIEVLSKIGLNNDFVIYMADSSSSNHTTIVKVIHDDGSWASGIRSLFIYGTGALRFSLLKAGGTPANRAFVISSTIGADAVSKILNNAINDPNYILNHINSWKTIWDGKSESAKIFVEGDKDTSQLVDKVGEITDNLTTKFIPDGKGLEEFSNNLFSNFMGYFKPFLQPVKVDYSNELLANQIHDISILLFILSIFIIILIIAFMFNILVYLYSDKISNYFTNKYIKMYVNFNKKIIGIELLFIGSSILYFMYILTYGIHFLATHPIVFT